LNSASAKDCVWQNNHAILLGKMLFYNKKNIQIKTEGSLLGYFPYKPMGLKAKVTKLQQVLDETREISFNFKLTRT
jgi:hypothetical protein